MPARVVVFSTFFDVSAIGRTLVGLSNRMAAAPADKFPAGARALAFAIGRSQADALRRVSRELAGPPAVTGGLGAAAAGPEPRAEPGRAGRHPARHRAGGQPHAAALSLGEGWRSGGARNELRLRLAYLGVLALKRGDVNTISFACMRSLMDRKSACNTRSGFHLFGKENSHSSLPPPCKAKA